MDMIEFLLTKEALEEIEDRLEKRILAKLKLDPTEQLVPQKAVIPIGEAFKLRGISHGTAINKPWLRFYKLAPREAPTRAEVVTWLKKSETELKAEYEIWLKKQGVRK